MPNSNIIYLLIGLGAGYLAWRFSVWPLKSKINFKEPKRKDKTEGLSRVEIDKNDNLEKVEKLFKENSEITNNEVERALGVSDATATKYLDKLENDGKIIQIGKEGRSVKYKLK